MIGGVAGQWIDAQNAAMIAEHNVQALIIGGGGVPDDEAILPGRDFDHIACDLSDWEGISLEFRGYVGEPPNEQERARLFALGFTVLRIDYVDPERWTTQHNFHGDWSCVKGAAPKIGKVCRVGVDPCPTHFLSATGNGACARLFGHDGNHEHAL